MNIQYLFARLLGYFISFWALVVFVVMIKTLQLRFDTIQNFSLIPISIAVCAFIFAIGQLLLAIRQVRLLVDSHPPTTPYKIHDTFWLYVSTGTLCALSGLMMVSCISKLIQSSYFDAFNSFFFGIIGFGIAQSAWIAHPIRAYFEANYYQVVPIIEKEDEVELSRLSLTKIIKMIWVIMLFCCIIPVGISSLTYAYVERGEDIISLFMGLTGILSIIVWGQVLHFLVQSDLAIKLIAEAQQKPFPPQSQSTKWAKTVQLGYRLVMASCLIPQIIDTFVGGSYIAIQENPDYLTLMFLLLPFAILFAIYTAFMSMGRMLRLAIRLRASFDD
ncbi:MAG: hypothetical protein SFZ02_18465 [bacterium]|nr:hypothetical protein [bacterium]